MINKRRWLLEDPDLGPSKVEYMMNQNASELNKHSDRFENVWDKRRKNAMAREIKRQLDELSERSE